MKAGPVSWVVALALAVHNRPARRVAYYAAVAALARLALLHIITNIQSYGAEALARAANRIAAWQYARRYLLHLRRHAIPFEELEVPCSPRRENSAGLVLPPITETEEPVASPMPKRRADCVAIGWERTNRAFDVPHDLVRGQSSTEPLHT